MGIFVLTPNVVAQQTGPIQDITDRVSTELRMLTVNSERTDQVQPIKRND